MPSFPFKRINYPVSATCQIPDFANKLQKLFGRRSRGFFVEVGAYDGERFSNTSCLADVGWSGIYIEPMPHLFAACRERHKRNSKVKTIELAASDHEGEMTLHVGDTLSTLVQEQVEDYSKIAWSKGLHQGERRTVRVARLDSILRENGVNRRFDLLSVDVEGHELEVFQGFDVDFWRPRAIIAELEDEHPDFRNNPRVVSRVLTIRQLLREAGYGLYYKDQINSIYVR